MISTLEQVMHQWAGSNKSSISINLSRKRAKGYSKWKLEVVEEWPGPNSEIDKRVNWINEKLEEWKTVRRTAWNMWEFDSKKEADKFLTLYLLVWA